jgi:hypothetical protein
MSQRVRRLQMLCWSGALCCVLIGCGGPVRAKPVQVDLARDTLVQVLDHWKSGGSIEELRTRKPEIVAQEFFWTKGMKLQEYRILGDGRPENANLVCEVELTLVPADGGAPTQKTVNYMVGTDPVLTVFRVIGD